MRLRHHHRPPITQPSHHAHRHGLDTRQPCTQTEPGAREAQGEPEPATPDSQRPAEDSGAREEPAPEDARQARNQQRRRGQRPAEDARQARNQREPAPPGNHQPAQHLRQPHRLHHGTTPTIWREGERWTGEKRGSGKKITA